MPTDPQAEKPAAAKSPKPAKSAPGKVYTVHRAIAVKCTDGQTRFLRAELGPRLDALLTPKTIDRLLKAGVLSLPE